MSDYNVKRLLATKPTGHRYNIFNRSSALTLKPSDTGSMVTNKGATGAIVITLPSGPRIGDYFVFVVRVAQELRVDPGDDTHVFYINGAAQTAGKYITADDEAESIEVVYVGDGEWVAYHETGTWTLEP